MSLALWTETRWSLLIMYSHRNSEWWLDSTLPVFVVCSVLLNLNPKSILCRFTGPVSSSDSPSSTSPVSFHLDLDARLNPGNLKLGGPGPNRITLSHTVISVYILVFTSPPPLLPSFIPISISILTDVHLPTSAPSSAFSLQPSSRINTARCRQVPTSACATIILSITIFHNLAKNAM